MKKGLIGFIAGSIFGGIIVIAFFLSEPTNENIEYPLIDYIISSWTQPIIDIQLAGFPSRVELPDARPGFFPDTVRALARLVDSLYKVPVGVTLCQFALESSWGRCNLGLSNYFGHSYAAVRPYLKNQRWAYRKDLVSIKGGPWKRQRVAFAEYENIAEAFLTHGKYLRGSKRYVQAFKTRSPEKFARALASGGYAQDPDYAIKLITIMRRYKIN